MAIIGQDRTPATGAGIAGAGAVGPDFNEARGRAGWSRLFNVVSQNLIHKNGHHKHPGGKPVWLHIRVDFWVRPMHLPAR